MLLRALRFFLIFNLLLAALAAAQELSIAELEQQALKLYSQSEFDQAAELYDEVIRREPENIEAYNSRGKILFEGGHPKRAEKDFDHAIALIKKGLPTSASLAHVYHRRAWAKIKMAELQAALLDVEQALELNPNYRNAWASRGVIQRRQTYYDDAIDSYERALEIDPSYLIARIDLVGVAMDLRDYELASNLCDSWRGSAEDAERSVYAGALETDSLAHKLPVNPSPATYYVNCALAKHRLGEKEKERDYLEHAASSTARDPYDYASRGRARFKLNQLHAALPDLTEALRLRPEDMGARLDRARLYYGLERFEEAERDYTEYLEREESSAALAGRALTRSRTGALDQARVDAERAVQVKPESAAAWDIYGFISAASGDFEVALQAYSQAVELAPKNMEFRRRRVGVLMRLQRYADAERDFGEILSQAPDSETHAARAFVRNQMGKRQQAREDVSVALRLNPDNNYARGLLKHIEDSDGRAVQPAAASAARFWERGEYLLLKRVALYILIALPFIIPF